MKNILRIIPLLICAAMLSSCIMFVTSEPVETTVKERYVFVETGSADGSAVAGAQIVSTEKFLEQFDDVADDKILVFALKITSRVANAEDGVFGGPLDLEEYDEMIEEMEKFGFTVFADSNNENYPEEYAEAPVMFSGIKSLWVEYIKSLSSEIDLTISYSLYPVSEDIYDSLVNTKS